MFLVYQQKRRLKTEMDLKYLEGKKMCVVFCQLQDEDQFQDENDMPDEGTFKIKCLHGRGNVFDNGKALRVEGDNGGFTVPASCYGRIYPSDGTDLLKDAEYFVMVKLDKNMEM